MSAFKCSECGQEVESLDHPCIEKASLLFGEMLVDLYLRGFKKVTAGNLFPDELRVAVVKTNLANGSSEEAGRNEVNVSQAADL